MPGIKDPGISAYRMTYLKIRKFSLVLLLSLGCSTALWAQAQPPDIALARQYAQNKEYDKAIPVFKHIYEQAPFDKGVYDEYLDALVAAGQYTDAETLVQYMMKIRREDPVMLLDLGRVYDADNKKKKATEQYEAALNAVSGEEFRTRQLADAFTRMGNTDYALKVYDRARTLSRNPYAYGTEMALLYGKKGNAEGASAALMDVLVTQPNALDDVKASLLKITEGDERKLEMVRKQIGKRISAQPDNPYWVELMTWIYTQKGDYAGAFQSVVALDKKMKEAGERVMAFAGSAIKDGQPVIAQQCYEYVMQKGKDGPMYDQAWAGKIDVLQTQVAGKKPLDERQVAVLLKEYHNFLQEYPQYNTSTLVQAYAEALARYGHQVDSAIALLEKAITAPNASREFVGYCKLDLGDYNLLQDKVWNATLLYSQVDKAFKEDRLAEEARFRNAKLAYYRGDFKWAQQQLAVLKASTSELIANDALYLSVLITENSAGDSIQPALQRFAAADMLLFQNKTRESDQLLDSIAKAFPDNALQDDILLLRAKIAGEEGRNNDAITYLEKILKDYGTDVLGDDAAYRLALLYDEVLKDKARALQYYEVLITQYPGSTYIQAARARYQKLKDPKDS